MLFRGENIERLKAGDIGLGWSSNPDVARTFGKGLNSTPGGGALLSGFFDPKQIIAGPIAHSKYLGEDQFTVDPFANTKTVITTVELYPPCRNQ